MSALLDATALERFLPRSRFGAIRAASPIVLGLSGAAVYAVTTEAGEWVLRIPPAGEPQQRQLAVQRLASAHEVTPHLEWVDEETSATVSVRIGGPGFIGALRSPDARTPALESLADTLGQLHRVPADGIAPVDPLATARAWWEEQRGRPGFPAWASPLGAQVERIADVLERDRRTVLSHNDVNPGNVLWDGARAWLVDWGASGLTHPYYDLASLSVFLAVPDEQMLALLARQERAPIEPGQVASFFALRQLATAMMGLAFHRMVPDLTALPPTTLEGEASVSKAFGMVAAGALDMQSVAGQHVIASVLLRAALLGRPAG